MQTATHQCRHRGQWVTRSFVNWIVVRGYQTLFIRWAPRCASGPSGGTPLAAPRWGGPSVGAASNSAEPGAFTAVRHQLLLRFVRFGKCFLSNAGVSKNVISLHNRQNCLNTGAKLGTTGAETMFKLGCKSDFQLISFYATP